MYKNYKLLLFLGAAIIFLYLSVDKLNSVLRNLYLHAQLQGKIKKS